MRTILAALSLVIIAFAAVAVRGNDQPDEKTSLWMKQKLAASKNILEGLTKSDFDAIEKNANSMIAVGYLEKWVRADAPGYRLFTGEFEYANKQLVRASREKNLDQATLAYLQLTVSCVNCHKLIRD